MPVDYFSFFGLPRKLNLDIATLERGFYAMSRKLHPDLYAGRDSREQSWSLETEEARKTGEKKQIVPPDLLEEVFELNMQIEELRANKKMGEEDTSLIQELQQHKQALEQKVNDLFEELKRYWTEWDSAEESGNDVLRKSARDKMVDLLNRRSYIRNLVRDVNEVLGF